jgi:hypothetical protein
MKACKALLGPYLARVSPPALPFAGSAPATLASMLFLEQAKTFALVVVSAQTVAALALVTTPSLALFLLTVT